VSPSAPAPAGRPSGSTGRPGSSTGRPGSSTGRPGSSTGHPGGSSGDALQPVYLVRGSDDSLVAQAARSLVERLVGGRDPALVVEEHGGASEDVDAGRILDACTTPPFLIDRRVVVVRGAGRLDAAAAARIVSVLEDPSPSVSLVLVGGGGTVPQALVKAVGRVGEIIDVTVRTRGDRTKWMGEQLHEAPVRLDAAATRRLGEHLGEDLGRLAGLLDTLASAYGAGAKVGVDELEPFLGGAGAVPPWELTDAIDAGSTDLALDALRRMTGAGGRPPILVLGDLHRHYSRLLRLDGAGATSPPEAAEILGEAESFVVKKALAQSNRLGTERLAQAIVLIADADLDVKGRTALLPEVVLEVLVARLSRLARTRHLVRR